MNLELTKSLGSMLLLVQAINELAESNKLNDDEAETDFESASDVYALLYENNPKDTLNILWGIVELAELGCVRTDITEEDLEEVEEMGDFFLINDMDVRITLKGKDALEEFLAKGDKDVIEYVKKLSAVTQNVASTMSNIVTIAGISKSAISFIANLPLPL